MQYEPSSSIFPPSLVQESSYTPAQDITSAAGDADSSPVDSPKSPNPDLANSGRTAFPPSAPRLLAWNGNINDESIPDYVEPPHEETDDEFVNRLVDSESDDEDDEDSDFGDNG